MYISSKRWNLSAIETPEGLIPALLYKPDYRTYIEGIGFGIFDGVPYVTLNGDLAFPIEDITTRSMRTKTLKMLGKRTPIWQFKALVNGYITFNELITCTITRTFKALLDDDEDNFPTLKVIYPDGNTRTVELEG